MRTPQEIADLERLAAIHQLCIERADAMDRIAEIDNYIDELTGRSPETTGVPALQSRESIQRLAHLLYTVSACTANGARGEQG
jgi:hypothetical protein